MYYMETRKKPTSIRLSAEGKRLQKALADKLGLSASAVIELALRRLAEQEGIEREKSL
jgi:antitoxin component of RelBE/YafQ-DinJ toxin-antitoxin module